MSGTKDFLDTNVLLYLLSADPRKADKAEQLLAGGGTISVQVLNEFASVARRKLAMGWPEIREVLDTVREVCRVSPVTEETHDRALELAEREGFSFYDSLILAAAQLTGCDRVQTEDMQNGRQVAGVLISNPFAEG